MIDLSAGGVLGTAYLGNDPGDLSSLEDPATAAAIEAAV